VILSHKPAQLNPKHIMRIFPIALIVIGMLGVAKHLGFIPIGMLHLIGPLLLIALGVALLFRRPRRCRNDRRARSGGGSTNPPQPPSHGLV
jgi:uncharacterized membrane protein YfcA